MYKCFIAFYPYKICDYFCTWINILLYAEINNKKWVIKSEKKANNRGEGVVTLTDLFEVPELHVDGLLFIYFLHV